MERHEEGGGHCDDRCADRSGAEAAEEEIADSGREASRQEALPYRLFERRNVHLTTVDATGTVAALNAAINEVSSRMLNIAAVLESSITMTSNTMTSTINNVSTVIDSITESMNRMNVTALQVFDSISQAANQAGKGTEGLVSNLKAMASNFSSKENFVQATIGGATEEQQVIDQMHSRLGSENAMELFEGIKKSALAAGQDVNKALQGGLSLFNGDVGQTVELTDIAAHLSVFDTGGKGMKGSISAVKAATNGDAGALSRSYGIDKGVIESSGLLDKAKSGDMAGFISSFQTILELQGMAGDGFDNMLASPTTQVQILGNTLKYALADAGMGAMQALLPLITMLNEAFLDGKFQPFFDGIGIGLSLLAQGLAQVAQFAQWLGSIFMTVLPYAGPLILGIAAAVGTYLLITQAAAIAVQVWTAAQGIFNAVMAMNPISLIILLIVGLIVAFLAIIATLQPVREFVADAFRSMGEVISKSVGFYIDAWVGFINGFIDGVNIFLSGINKVINAVGKFIGIDAKIDLELNKIDGSKFKNGITNGIDDAFNAAADATENFNADKWKQKIDNSLGKPIADPNKDLGGTPGALMMPTDPVMPPSPEMPVAPAIAAPPAAAGTIPDINKVGEVGQINDSVDVTSEDMKMMRELAEMKNIQNFVSLTPSVNVTHTGNINNGYDVDTIVGRIKTSLETEIASSAQGVYK
ncbi:hypothetical protein ACFOLF_12010 [Paenibacillus sepulcri]|uniref:Phage tail tape measure protein n=1 Tax=Paenibacillus sepulcri TaxID=359917 RepID=A0ABS7C9K0_9BACL|nr:hypothetical protein [Paenibacillus sepulcri]